MSVVVGVVIVRSRSDRMCRVVAIFVREVDMGRCSVRVGYRVSQVVVVMACSAGIVMVCGGVNYVVAIDYSS